MKNNEVKAIYDRIFDEIKTEILEGRNHGLGDKQIFEKSRSKEENGAVYKYLKWLKAVKIGKVEGDHELAAKVLWAGAEYQLNSEKHENKG